MVRFCRLAELCCDLWINGRTHEDAVNALHAVLQHRDVHSVNAMWAGDLPESGQLCSREHAPLFSSCQSVFANKRTECAEPVQCILQPDLVMRTNCIIVRIEESQVQACFGGDGIKAFVSGPRVIADLHQLVMNNGVNENVEKNKRKNAALCQTTSGMKSVAMITRLMQNYLLLI